MTKQPVWRQLHWPPLDEAAALAAMRAWSADHTSPQIVLEARATKDGVAYLLGTALVTALTIKHQLRTAVPDARLTEPLRERQPVQMARRLRLSTRQRQLRIDQLPQLARAVLGALTASLTADETLVLQLVLGPRRVPLAIPNNSPSSIVMPTWQVAWQGNGGQIDGEKRASLRTKVSDHGAAATVRLGVAAATPARRQVLLQGLFDALKLAEAPGLTVSLRPDSAQRLNAGSRPRWYSLRLNASEVLALSAWPVGDSLPGQPPIHPRLIAPNSAITGKTRVIAKATAPGVDALLVQPIASARVHTHLVGPTGTGKTTLMNNLIVADMEADYGVIVVDPQGDQLRDLLSRIPPHRLNDVCILDAADQSAVAGLNPLLTRGRSPEVVADSAFGVFKGLYGDSLGPRSSDLLLITLLTMTKAGDTSLAMLPMFLGNDRVRRQITKRVHDPLVLGPYWQWFDSLSTNERSAIIAPLLNKARPLLARSALRHTIGQVNPKLSISEVFRDHRILLVSLAQGTLGPEGAATLGGVVVAACWQATTERYSLSPTARKPITIWLDEFSAYSRIPNNMTDALARSRGANISYVLAHQYMSQLTPAMKAAVLANTRSRVCFRLADEDAALMARGQSVLEPADFTALGAHEVYYAGFAAGRTLPYASGRTLPPSAVTSDAAEVRALSQQRWAQPVAAIERELLDRLHGSEAKPEPPLGRTPRRRA